LVNEIRLEAGSDHCSRSCIRAKECIKSALDFGSRKVTKLNEAEIILNHFSGCHLGHVLHHLSSSVSIKVPQDLQHPLATDLSELQRELRESCALIDCDLLLV
jgi:hypothetical protein